MSGWVMGANAGLFCEPAPDQIAGRTGFVSHRSRAGSEQEGTQILSPDASQRGFGGLSGLDREFALLHGRFLVFGL